MLNQQVVGSNHPEGRDARVYAKLAESGLQLHWQSIPVIARAKKSSKTKFTCPDCGQNAWAKPNALLICGECFDEGEGDMCFMLAEQSVERLKVGAWWVQVCAVARLCGRLACPRRR